jgi:hypothetical protein
VRCCLLATSSPISSCRRPRWCMTIWSVEDDLAG